MKTGVFILVMVSAATADAAPRLLALDDAYDCDFTRDGTLVVATSGGLRIGGIVVTALEGMPETRVEALEIDADRIRAVTRSGTAQVSLSGRVSEVVREGFTPPPLQAFERFGEGIVRARKTVGDRACIATSDGAFVSRAGERLTRIGAAALPSGDVAALAVGVRGLYVGTFDRGLFRFDGVALHAVVDPALHPHINALVADAGLLWVATARGLVRCEEGDAPRCRRVGDGFAKHALLVHEGRVIAGGDESLLFLDRDGTVTGQSTRKQGARFRSVWAIARAADGMIFVGTTSGIFHGDERVFVSAPERLQRASMVRGTLADDWVTALALRGDELLVGTYNAGIASLRRRGNELTVRQVDATLGYVNPGGLAGLPSGEWAVSTMTGLKVGRFGAFHEVPTLGRDVTAVVATDAARWVATRRGVTTF